MIMRLGEKIKKKKYGWGIITHIDENGYEVSFLNHKKIYQHSNFEVYFACVIWALAFVLFLYIIL